MSGRRKAVAARARAAFGLSPAEEEAIDRNPMICIGCEKHMDDCICDRVGEEPKVGPLYFYPGDAPRFVAMTAKPAEDMRQAMEDAGFKAEDIDVLFAGRFAGETWPGVYILENPQGAEDAV